LGDLFFLFGRSMKWGYISMCNKQGTRIGNDRKRSKKIEKRHGSLTIVVLRFVSLAVFQGSMMSK